MGMNDPLKELLQAIVVGDDDGAERAAREVGRSGELALPALRALLTSDERDRRWWAVRALAAAPPFPAAVSPAGEYHRYTLPEPVDLGPGTVLVPLFSAALPYERIYRFQGGRVETVIRFRNAAQPLPAGEVAAYEEEGRLFVGAAAIGHTPVGEEVRLTIGAAFDLTGERTQISHVRLGEDLYRETYRIVIRSAKEEPVEVEVLESLTGSWTITRTSLPYEVLDAHTVKFLLAVPAGGEADLSYTVEWSYR